MKERKQIHGERSDREAGRNCGRCSIIAIKNNIFKKEIWLAKRLSKIIHEKCTLGF